MPDLSLNGPQLVAALESLSIGAALTDVRATIALVNTTFATLIGCATEDLIGKTLDQVDVDGSGNGLLSVDDGPDFSTGPREIEAVCGPQSIVKFTITALHAQGSAAAGFLVTSQADIATQCNHSNERARANLSALIESTSDLIWSVDLDYGLIEFNRALEDNIESFGAFARPGPGPQELLPPDRAALWPPLYERALSEGAFRSEYLLIDGRTLELAFNPIVENGCKVGVSVFGKDISARKVAEEATIAAERNYREIFEGALEGIYRTRPQGQPLTVNPALAKMLGYESSEEFLSAINDLGHQVWLDPQERAAFVRSLELEGVVHGYECRCKRKDGSVVWTSISSRRVTGPGGDTLYYEGFIEDITARKLAEQERQRLQEQLTQAQKIDSVGRLAGGLAHDFNNLLTVINGYGAMLLARMPADDPNRGGVEEILRAGESAAELTRRLLTFSRKQPMQLQVVDLNAVVGGMRSMLPRVLGDDIDLRVDLAATRQLVRADPHQLEQVLMNLTINARDAMPDGGILSIQTADVALDAAEADAHPGIPPGSYVSLAVSDSGVGIDEEIRNRIFEPFFTTKNRERGTGLGLSVVHGIVAESGGHIEVETELGEGTTFRIYFPPQVRPEIELTPPDDTAVSKGRETVLVVEDQQEVRKLAVRVLIDCGYRVLESESGERALEIATVEPGPIHLLVTDVVMPKIGGRELASRLRQFRAGIRVLFMSGYGDTMERNETADHPAHVLAKPFRPAELAAKVREVLDQPRARILVVDDDSAVRGFLRRVLEQERYQVLEAPDCRTAIRQVREKLVDLVIMDLVMPLQEGIETIPALRREAPGVGIIAISGAFDGRYLKIAQLMGVSAALLKPVSAEEVLTTVAGVLSQGRRFGASAEPRS